ncbi:MAG TPA: hypothetical protein VHL53_19070 [Acidimicrobiia bacterium]|nr:hypothetical protein [Acidimicrobiia bacterium]
MSRFELNHRRDRPAARAALGLDDVGDRWRALLIGAPPGRPPRPQP